MLIKALYQSIIGLAVAAVIIPSAVAQSLPDLTITDLKVNEKCQIVVTIKNNGPGELPSSAFMYGSTPALQLYRDNSPYGFWSMNKQELKKAGGTYVYVVLAENKKVSGTQNIRAVIDNGNVVNEANENNNSMQRTLTCNPQLPDLAIEKIDFAADCRTIITIRNIGKAQIPSNSFNSIYVSRTVDGQGKGYFRLIDADPSRAVLQPGGQVVWTDFAEFKAKKDVKYQAAGLSMEASNSNNSGIANVPPRCTAGGSRPKAPLRTIPESIPRR